MCYSELFLKCPLAELFVMPYNILGRMQEQ